MDVASMVAIDFHYHSYSDSPSSDMYDYYYCRGIPNCGWIHTVCSEVLYDSTCYTRHSDLWRNSGGFDHCLWRAANSDKVAAAGDLIINESLCVCVCGVDNIECSYE